MCIRTNFTIFASEINRMKTIRITILLLLFLNGVCLQIAFGHAKIDSLLLVLENSQHDKEKVEIMTLLAEQYFDSNNTEQARSYVWEAHDICVKQSIDIPIELHFIKAKLLRELSAPWDAYLEIEKAIEKIPENDVALRAKARNYRAYYLLNSGRFMDAIKQYNSNLIHADTNNLDNYSAKAILGLANVNNATNDSKSEIDFLHQYIEKVDEKGDSIKIRNGYFRLGEVYLKDSVFEPSGVNFFKSFVISKAIKDTSRMAFDLLRVAWVNYLDENLELSIKQFNEALQYAKAIDKKSSINNALGNLGTIYRDLKEYDKALENYWESIKVSKEISDYYNLSWVFNDMSSMYGDMGDYKNAYHYFQMFKTYNDSLENQRFRLGLERARTLFETEKKQQELELLSLKLKQNQNFVYGLTGLIILLILIALLIIRQIRIASKKRFSEMNHRLSELTQKNLRQQMNPHFIFNTLNSIQYYMYQHDKIATNDYMSKFSSLMRKTLENSRHTSIPIRDELDALKLYLDLEALRFKQKFRYQIEVDEEIDLLMHKIPTMLIQPYVENSICHGLMHKDEADGLVKVDLKLEESTIICTIQDNGVGRDAAMKIKNNNNNSHRSLGTTITESRLKIVNSLYGKSMKIDYYDLKNTDGTPSGTRVVIHIPIIT